MLKNAALAALAAAALVAPGAAYEAKFYDGEGTCGDDPRATISGTSSTECHTFANPGTEGGTSYVTVACSSDTTASAWTVNRFEEADCKGGSSPVTKDSAGCQANWYVDCGEGLDDACYSGASTVRLEGGAVVPMSQLNPGDRVQSVDEDGNIFYDKVFRVTHWDQETTASFVRLTTDSGRTLELTGQHYVHAGGLEHENLKLASEVAEGDELFVVGDDGEVRVSPVTGVERTRSQGLYNVHTLSSRVVVNGVVGSHFSTASSWGDNNGKASLWYKLVDAASVLLGAENARLE